MNTERLEQSRRQSFIGMHSNNNVTYAMQYKRAFDSLYESSNPIDTISLPMMFLMRHYLELILKYNIKYFSEFSDSTFMLGKIKSEHKLKPLAEGFQQHWKIVVKKYNIEINDEEYISNFESLIELLDNIDKYSMSFRYSHTKDDDKHFEWNDTLDIYSIKILLDKVTPLLDYSSDVFNNQVGQYLKMEEEMQKEMERELMSDMYNISNYQ